MAVTSHRPAPVLRKRMGERLRQWRTARRWSQQRMADELGVCRESVARWEQGRSAPCLALLGLLGTLGLDLTQLFTGLSAEHWSA